MIHPDAGKRQYQYDADGNLLKSIDDRGQIVSRTWDAASRPLVERQLDATGAEVSRVEYHYDAPNPRFSDAAFNMRQQSWVNDAAREAS